MEGPHYISGNGQGRRSAVGMAALAILAMARLLHGAQEVDAPREYEVKAAFLLNFTRFVEWPGLVDTGDAPFSICILGDDPFGPVLDRIVEGESVNGRRLAIRRIGRPHLNSCQVVFFAGHEKDTAKILAGLSPGVLTIGDGAAFLREGGMIAFVLENRRVRFDINQSAAAKAGIRISSKLLSVARSVEK